MKFEGGSRTEISFWNSIFAFIFLNDQHSTSFHIIWQAGDATFKPHDKPAEADQWSLSCRTFRRRVRVAMQTAALATLTAASQNSGLNMELVTTVRNRFQRLYRKARNRGEEGLATTFRVYADDFQRLLVWKNSTFDGWLGRKQCCLMVRCWKSGTPGNPETRRFLWDSQTGTLARETTCRAQAAKGWGGVQRIWNSAHVGWHAQISEV